MLRASGILGRVRGALNHCRDDSSPELRDKEAAPCCSVKAVESCWDDVGRVGPIPTIPFESHRQSQRSRGRTCWTPDAGRKRTWYVFDRLSHFDDLRERFSAAQAAAQDDSKRDALSACEAVDTVGLVSEGRPAVSDDRRGTATSAGGPAGEAVESLRCPLPPVKYVPTDVHRAVFELALAAVVCRQSHTRPDRHPFFVCEGGTLRWKSSLGIFLCHALGVDPGGHLVECAAEAGKSLFVRRDAEGRLIYERALLGTSLIILDEFQAATPGVRAAVAPLLSGRLTVPVENDRLSMRCVPLVLLNPAEKLTLEERLGLSPPLIRRALIANLDAVEMPDLAIMGERALAAAQAYPPLTVSPPRADCQKYERRIIDLLRDILNEDATERLDVQMVVNLCTGMTAWLPDPTDAIAQVAHGVGILAETMAWTRAGWLQTVIDFSLDPRRRPSAVLANRDEQAERPVQGNDLAPSQTIDLHIPQLRREANLPDLSLSNELRGRLTWLAVDSGRPVDEVLNILMDLYSESRRYPDTVATLGKIVMLARSQDRAEVDVDSVHRHLMAEETLARHGYRFDDVPQALELIESLAALPQSWTWTMVKSAIQAVSFLIENGIKASEVAKVLRRHQRLGELGFDESEAEAVAGALVRAGAVGNQRTRVLRYLVALAGKAINAAELERERICLEKSVKSLRAEKAELEARPAFKISRKND